MKYILTIFLITTLFTTNQDLIGIYEYKSSEKSENHYIVFDKVDGTLKGFYFGSEDGKGHGIFFYATTMNNLTIHEKGKIEFDIGDRELFETTRFKIEKTQSRYGKPVGLSRGTLKYKGQLSEGRIKLTCDSEFQDCWAKELVFEKIK